MPLPSPKGKQDKDSFVSNCMGDETMKSEFPKQAQRYAVCQSKYKQSKKKSKGSDISWRKDGDIDDNFIVY